MRLYYIAHARMPTEKAHGFTLAKSCEAFADAGVEVTLVLPRRYTDVRGSVYDAYEVRNNFAVKFLPVLDLLRVSTRRAAFAIQVATFYASVLTFMLFRSRKDTVIYTREVPLILLSYIGYPVVYECHHLFNRSRTLFWLCRRARRIVTISRSLKDLFVQEGFDERDVLVAPSGVDLSTFDIPLSREQARKELDLPPEGTIAVYTGNFTTMGEDKGLRDCIHALKNAPNVLLVAAGGTEKDIRQYEQAARGAGVLDRVILRGRAPQKELAVYQKAADVLLMVFPDTPHYRSHMSPVKMFEYMASGRPILASDLPTIREVLNDSNALLVPPGSPEAIAGQLEVIARDPRETQRRADAALAQVTEYSWEQRARRIVTAIGV